MTPGTGLMLITKKWRRKGENNNAELDVLHALTAVTSLKHGRVLGQRAKKSQCWGWNPEV